MTPTPAEVRGAARTEALREALVSVDDWRSATDLLFLEAWLAQPSPGAAAALRVVQLRRANPTLAAAIDAELRGKPAIVAERPGPARQARARSR